MTVYFIQPKNEGQDLNYSETFHGSLSGAKERAEEMRVALKRVLKDGTITVDVQDENGENVVKGGK